MASALADFVGSYTVTQQQMIDTLQGAGVRCDTCLNALSPNATSSTSFPRALAEYADTYVLDTAAKVQAVLDVLGPRGWSFFELFLTYKA